MTTSVSYDEVYKTRWLKSDDIPDEDLVLTIRDVIDEEVGDEKEIKFILIFSEIQKQLILNKTNARILSDRFGKNPSAWLNKRIGLYATEVPFGGKTTLAIRIRLKGPAPAQPAVAQPPDVPDDVAW